eukprot:1017173-Rhodomonas_salina.4
MPTLSLSLSLSPCFLSAQLLPHPHTNLPSSSLLPLPLRAGLHRDLRVRGGLRLPPLLLRPPPPRPPPLPLQPRPSPSQTRSSSSSPPSCCPSASSRFSQSQRGVGGFVPRVPASVYSLSADRAVCCRNADLSVFCNRRLCVLLALTVLSVVPSSFCLLSHVAPACDLRQDKGRPRGCRVAGRGGERELGSARVLRRKSRRKASTSLGPPAERGSRVLGSRTPITDPRIEDHIPENGRITERKSENRGSRRS